jgi:RES domain-containing protein
MMLYRFASEKYKNDLSGQGARLYGGRWNSRGLVALYTSESVSLSLLEVLAHAVQYDDLKKYFLMALDVADDVPAYKIPLANLNDRWLTDINYTRFIGDSFLRDNKYLLLEVPSVVVKTESNYIINPLHKDFKKVKLVSSKPFSFDNRLLK